MEKFKVIGIRFGKAFIAGALSACSLVAVALFTGVTTWVQLGSSVNTLAIVAIGGGITGVIMGGDKWLRWQN